MQLYLRSFAYFRRDVPQILLSLLLTAAATGCMLLQFYPLPIAIDCVFGNAPPVGWMYRAFFALLPADKVGQIIALAGMMLGMRVLQELLALCQSLVNLKIGYHALMRVRCDLFRKLQELSLAYHKSQPQGDAIYRMSSDAYAIQTIFNIVVQTMVISSVTLLILAAIMFSMNWKLTLIALAVAPPLFWTTKVYGRILQKKATEAKEVDSELTTSIQRSVATIGLVQAFGREKDEYHRFSTTANNSVAAYLRLYWQELVFWVFVGMIFGIGGAAIFGYGGYLVYKDQMVRHLGENGMTVGKLTLFIFYLQQLYAPLNKLSGSGTALASAVAGMKRVFEIFDRDPTIKDAPNALHLPRQARTLKLENVVFEYRAGQPVLCDISCTIAPGQMVAFVGSSGVGKTTLLNLLPRFYDPVKGAICLDDHDLRQIKISDLRKHIALVLQEHVILPTSVAENIAYGRPDASNSQIRKAAEIAGASVFIEKLPRGYDEEINEGGQNLSGGQKQRISIARALLTEAPIIVMDEPTSALDPQHEQMITETLRGLKRHRTIILVSHRLSTVAECDQIFVMDEGKIVEQGTHEQLVAKGGLYYKMARHQMKVGEVAETTGDAKP